MAEEPEAIARMVEWERGFNGPNRALDLRDKARALLDALYLRDQSGTDVDDAGYAIWTTEANDRVEQARAALAEAVGWEKPE